MISSSHTSVANPNSETLENQSQEKFTAALSKGYSSSRRQSGATSHANPLLDLCCLKGKLHLGAHTELTWGTFLFQDLSLGGFFLASTSFLKSSSFFAMLGIFKKKTKRSKPTQQKIWGYMTFIRKDNTTHKARNSIKFKLVFKRYFQYLLPCTEIKSLQYRANSR